MSRPDTSSPCNFAHAKDDVNSPPYPLCGPCSQLPGLIDVKLNVINTAYIFPLFLLRRADGHLTTAMSSGNS